MAHQTAHIPWNVLASNLLWSEAKHLGNGDLHLRFQPDQGKKLEYFVEALVRSIGEHSSTSRKKYPEHYDPPHPDDIILDDATASKIAPTVRRWCASGEMREYLEDRCRGDDSAAAEEGRAKWNLNDVIPDEERRAAAFYRSYRGNDCFDFFDENGEAFFNLEVVKTLLLYGEMDIIFRVCANPDVDLGTWWRMGTCDCGVRAPFSFFLCIYCGYREAILMLDMDARPF